MKAWHFLMSDPRDEIFNDLMQARLTDAEWMLDGVTEAAMDMGPDEYLEVGRLIIAGDDAALGEYMRERIVEKIRPNDELVAEVANGI